MHRTRWQIQDDDFVVWVDDAETRIRIYEPNIRHRRPSTLSRWLSGLICLWATPDPAGTIPMRLKFWITLVSPWMAFKDYVRRNAHASRQHT